MKKILIAVGMLFAGVQLYPAITAYAFERHNASYVEKTTEVVKPEAVKPEAVKPEAVKPEPVKPEQVQPVLVSREPAKQEPAPTKQLTREQSIQQNCAAARIKHDQLYKAGVAHPEEQVDVRAACEPDAVEQETISHWVFGILIVLGVIFFLPMLLMGSVPSTMR